jgi:hypothetical protein
MAEIAKTQGATPFDASGVRLGHRDGKCSFETIIEEHKLEDPVLHELAKIVRSADTRDTELAPGGIGLSAIMTGARYNMKDDFEAVKKPLTFMAHPTLIAKSSCCARSTRMNWGK